MTLILSGTDGLSDVDGSAATPAIRGTDANTGIFFPAADQVATSVGGVEGTRLTSTGLGIGTSSPSQKLEVTGNILINTSGNPSMTVKTSGAGNNPSYRLQADTTYWDIGASFSDATDPLTFNYGGTERARIDSSGNLLVGTTSIPDTQGFGVLAYSGGTYTRIAHNTSAGSTDGYIQFFYNSSQIGSVQQNGTTNVAYTTSSDYRLKENIAPMTGALAKVALLKPCTYTWKSDGSDGQGFIAHELQVVVPDCVTGEKDGVETYTDEEGNEQTRPVYQGIDTSFLVATLTAALQEAHGLIKSLEARVVALEAK